MNRREFLSVLGGASALSVINVHPSFATGADAKAATTTLYVKGLVMVDLGNPDFVRLGFPKAPGHKATLSIVPQNGSQRTLSIKGNGSVEPAGTASTDPHIFVPELVRMKEFYGPSVKSHVDQCPSVITIPTASITSVTTAEVSPTRYTFVRSDTGAEIDTFRPRQIAETLKIDLLSAGTLKLDGGKVNIPLQTARELRMQYQPDRADEIDPFAAHFNHYFDYVERPAALDYLAVPKKLGGGSSTTPKVGNRFIDLLAFCYMVAVP
jgi:hypothetical protein